MNRFGLLLLATLATGSAFQGGASAQTIPTTTTMTNAFSPNVEVRISGALVKNDPVAFVREDQCNPNISTDGDNDPIFFTFKLTSLPSTPINNLEAWASAGTSTDCT